MKTGFSLETRAGPFTVITEQGLVARCFFGRAEALVFDPGDTRLREALERFFADGREDLSWVELKQSAVSGLALKVYDHLRRNVGPGQVISYKQLADACGTGPRAIGRLMASNPWPVVVPCHRVVRSDGSLGGYSGGLDRKRWLLELESS